MTELEKQLLSALEQLQQDYLEKAGRVGRTPSRNGGRCPGLCNGENAALSERVTGLSRQVQSLSDQLRRIVARLNGIEAHREQERGAAPESAGAGNDRSGRKVLSLEM